MTVDNDSQRQTELANWATQYGTNGGKTTTNSGAAIDVQEKVADGSIAAPLLDEKRRLSGLSYYGKPAT